MGLIESVRSVFWARKRQPDDVAYVLEVAHERFSPQEALAQAIEAERAGFDAVCGSDHLAPWWLPGDVAPAHCGNLWVWLGAVGQATRELSIGSGVTGLVHRYNPVVVAQQIATLESLFPGRAFLGVGSSEAMNEVPAGMEWPDTHEQLERTEEALTIVTRLLDGETVDFRGQHFRTTGARLYVRPERRPPVYMSAFYPQAAQVAGRLADGVWTLADPRSAPEVVAAYRRGAEEAGREPGEIVLQGLFSWAEDDDAALEAAREWKATLVDECYTEPIWRPEDVWAQAEDVSDTTLKAMAIVSSDPKSHVRNIKLLQGLGATALVLMNVSGAHALGAVRAYGEHVLPELRG